MMPHRTLDDTARDSAALYALDSLPAAEAREFERHLETCAACRDEVRSYDGTVEALALASPESMPPADLYARLLGRARPERSADAAANSAADATPARAIPPPPGFSYVRAGEGEWRESGVQGVTARPLSIDAATGRITMLVRMAPGAAYPGHRHALTEECYVLQGDVSAHGIRLGAGDFLAADALSLHGVQSTEGGCLLLLIGSVNDELLLDQSPRYDDL